MSTEEEGAFDVAIEGVDTAIHGVPHTISLLAGDTQDLIPPAVCGSDSIFNSALKHGRTIITTSITDIVRADVPPGV
ncbi:hypothetical protein C8Q73DRAFT_789914 [Cubamyces lactineus]|nr:hypothetical protein C8Q73DRAFT_789914 [Cubamyces lactineus]